MINCAEYVSLGHSDKTADAIASYLLDEYIKHDPKVRFALEVQLKDHVCNLAGEVTSTWKPTSGEIEFHVKEAIRKVGYTAQYAARWPEGATLNADNVVVNNFIGQQSPNIAQGVDREGWGDQGVFAGMATDEAVYDFLPRDVYFARKIGRELYKAAKDNVAPIGLDIKTLVSIAAEGVEQVIVAAPIIPGNEAIAHEFIEDIVEDVLAAKQYTCKELIINGTGSYVIHSSVGDAGVVGRKLAVDFYGLNCPIGGGTTWGKDGTKADVTLNLAARYHSLYTMLVNFGKYKKVFTKISCCIGRSKCLIVQTDENGNVIMKSNDEMIPSELIKKFGLNGIGYGNCFFSMCANGLFSHVDNVALQYASTNALGPKADA